VSPIADFMAVDSRQRRKISAHAESLSVENLSSGSRILVVDRAYVEDFQKHVAHSTAYHLSDKHGGDK
jgi:hypothetical protein